MSNDKLWAERVAAWRASGVSGREFCEGGGFSAAALYKAAQRLSRRAPAAVGAALLAPVAPTVRIARVQRSAPAEEEVLDGGAGAVLTVELGVARVLVPSGFDVPTLEIVFGALHRATKAGR